jgi:NAD(P)-dependent dehydrogenase (short-subunit alcohol dehydrogenase family)
MAAATAVGGLAYAVSGSGTAANILRGKVVLITGAGGGVGREAALAFARRGAHLVLWDLSEAGLVATKGAVAAQAAAMAAVAAAEGGAASEAAGGKPAAVPGVETGVVDISSREEVYGAAAAVQQLRWGGAAPLPVFAVVNNAGIVSGGAPILEADDARVVKTFQVRPRWRTY